jgi:aspartyl-tRNA(Asn)/glutamyl-tRNA(Gln) amidotransferase subunit C
MTAITPDEVAHLARLARLDLDADELAHLAGQLDAILSDVAEVSSAAAADVPPTSHPLPLTNVTRPDVPSECLSPEAALAGAPAAEQGRFRVPRILDEEV